MSRQRTLVVVNPAAGSGRAAAGWARLREQAKACFTFDEVATAGPGDATRLAAEAESAGYTRLLSVGGDGTLHEIVNGCGSCEVAVGVLPLGTGNDFARSAGLRRPAAQLLPALAAGDVRRVDLGRVHDQYYLNIAGVGFDAEVARIANATAKRHGGALFYLITAVREAFRYEPAILKVALDAQEPPAPSRRLMVAIGNAAAYGGGMRICPRAELDDGLLDVMTVGDLRGGRILGILPLAFLGRHVGRPGVDYQQAKEVRIEGPAGVAVHADGELVGGLPATFTIDPGALRLWAPADAPTR